MKRRAFLSIFGALAALPALALARQKAPTLVEMEVGRWEGVRIVPWQVEVRAVNLNEDWMAAAERDRFQADVERFIREEIEPLARTNVHRMLYGRSLA